MSTNSFFKKDFVAFLCNASGTLTPFDELPGYSQTWFKYLAQMIIEYLSECETGETEEHLRAELTATRQELLRLGMDWMDVDSNCVHLEDLLEESRAEVKKQIDCGDVCGTVGQQCQACLRRMFHREVKNREMLQAEVEMLRGVGCNEDGDGPCGCCLKCVRQERNDYFSERNEAYIKVAMLEKQVLDQQNPALRHDEHVVNEKGKKNW